MANALDEFRAQREAAERLYARLKETSALLQSIQTDVAGLADHKALRESASTSSRPGLERAPHALSATSAHFAKTRYAGSGRRCGNAGSWRRRSRVPPFAFGSGYMWASRPYQKAELTSLRSGVELLDFVAQRVLTMSPEEYRQSEALMKWKTAPKR